MQTIKAQVILSRLTPKVDRSWKIEVITRELEGKDIQVLGDLLGTEGWFLYSANPEDAENFQAPDEKAEAGIGNRKTLSERLYNTLFAYWNYINKPEDDFDTWRKKQMERLISIYKDKMPERK